MNDILFYHKIDTPTSNLFGNYFCSITNKVYGTDDVRSKYGVFNTPWDHYTGYDKFISYPDLNNQNFVQISHNDICDQRALDLFRIAREQNKRIAILWSGGIDSTLVLSSFIKNITTSDLENLLVILNANSILENPEFYKKFITGKISCLATYDLNINNDFLDKNILLTGELGDGIYGPSSFIFLDLIKYGLHRLPWKNNTAQLINLVYRSATSHKFSSWYVNKVNENLSSVISVFDRIETIGDWWWWIYYNFKWERLIWNPIHNHKKNIKDPISTKNIEGFLKNTFFNKDEFHYWSYNNLQNLIPNDIKKHKIDAKKYIFELDHNQNYFDNKLKTPSNSKIKHKLHINPSICFDKNWIGYHSDDPLVKDFLTNNLDNYSG